MASSRLCPPTSRLLLSSIRPSFARTPIARRSFASVQDTPANPGARSHKVVVVGGGPAGLAISHQLLTSGKFVADDIAVVDPATTHDYQPGWTLVGGGIKTREELRRPMATLIDSKLKFYNQAVQGFSPDNNQITLANGDKLAYEQLVVAPGIKINYGSVKGLPEALADEKAPVSSIYGYDTCSKVFPQMKKLQKGTAIFTQPAGVIKCAGAPQKIMWLGLDHWKQAGLYKAHDANSPIKIAFATGLPTMFGVPKYAARLEELRKERGVEGLFQHDLKSIEGSTATFTRIDTKEDVKRPFDFLHVVPKMGPHEFVAKSALADEAGYVSVNQETLQHTKYSNVWSAGDASNVPTSKTAAAITGQCPVLTFNLLRTMEGKEASSKYYGYTSCPLVTEYGKVMMAEFKFGGVPDETFGKWLGWDQATPSKLFYHIKKDFFPWIYYKALVKGHWAGPKGYISSIK